MDILSEYEIDSFYIYCGRVPEDEIQRFKNMYKNHYNCSKVQLKVEENDLFFNLPSTKQDVIWIFQKPFLYIFLALSVIKANGKIIIWKRDAQKLKPFLDKYFKVQEQEYVYTLVIKSPILVFKNLEMIYQSSLKFITSTFRQYFDCSQKITRLDFNKQRVYESAPVNLFLKDFQLVGNIHQKHYSDVLEDPIHFPKIVMFSIFNHNYHIKSFMPEILPMFLESGDIWQNSIFSLFTAPKQKIVRVMHNTVVFGTDPKEVEKDCFERCEKMKIWLEYRYGSQFELSVSSTNEVLKRKTHKKGSTVFHYPIMAFYNLKDLQSLLKYSPSKFDMIIFEILQMPQTERFMGKDKYLYNVRSILLKLYYLIATLNKGGCALLHEYILMSEAQIQLLTVFNAFFDKVVLMPSRNLRYAHFQPIWLEGFRPNNEAKNKLLGFLKLVEMGNNFDKYIIQLMIPDNEIIQIVKKHHKNMVEQLHIADKCISEFKKFCLQSQLYSVFYFVIQEEIMKQDIFIGPSDIRGHMCS